MDYLRQLRVRPGGRVSLARLDPAETGGLRGRAKADRWLAHGVEQLAAQQDRLYAQNSWALLVILQAMDAAGKDSTIKHVMSGVNPQGCQIHSFKAPSTEELNHDYLWRSVKALPERGCIGIHNRSYYEEVLITQVHPEIIKTQHIPSAVAGKTLWEQRFRDINQFERHLVENGTVVLKFFLHVSKEEQRRRFLDRIEQPRKYWKFSLADVQERTHWDEYMAAYEDVFRHTSTSWAPWFIIPADHKWFTRIAVAEIIHRTLAGLDLHYPTVPDDVRKEWAAAKRLLENE
jgi:PPK2 family polyphosphate:nucleotide phosphotransferase